jgi:hypothetical protein
MRSQMAVIMLSNVDAADGFHSGSRSLEGA